MNSMTEIFGEPICGYSRAQAIEDGELVDVSQLVTPCPFKYPVAMSRAAYFATIAAGGTWEREQLPEHKEADLDGFAEVLKLPGCQDVAGRAWDVFTMLLAAIRAGRTTDKISFSVLVDVKGNGRKEKVDLYSVCGPGDDAAPVLTIMLRGED
jgi:hypothetical protein